MTRPWVPQRLNEFCAPAVQLPTGVVGVHRFFGDVSCACGMHRWSEWMAAVAAEGAEVCRN